jgi:inhibitor of cysteine peptidase
MAPLTFSGHSRRPFSNRVGVPPRVMAKPPPIGLISRRGAHLEDDWTSPPAFAPCGFQIAYGHYMNIVLREQDSGRTAHAPVGAHISVELPENPTTGFRWTQPQIDGVGVALESDDMIPLASRPAGSAGIRRFIFAVNSVTTCRIRLAYQRSWGSQGITNAPFEVTIVGTAS